MNIHLIAVGRRMPEWVQQGFQEYAGRMTGECRLRLIEVLAPRHRTARNVVRQMRTEGERMLQAIPYGVHVVALDAAGSEWSTEQLAARLAKWMSMGKDVALLVGGPDGLAPECKAAARESWGLSKLTFPHPLVRIIVAEQLYRSLSLLRNHPYHRQ